ncbi:MAG: MlaD family protein [Desulfobacterales bacterium]
MTKQNKPLFVLIFVILIVFATAIGGAFLIRSLEDIRLTVNFSDAKGLYENSAVEYKGVRIGTVSEIMTGSQSNIPVAIKIDSKHGDILRENALFVISSSISTAPPPGIIMGYCKDVDPFSSPKLSSGEVVDGENNEMVFTVKTRLGCFNQTTDSFSKALENLKHSIDNVLNSPKAQELYKDMENFFIDLHLHTQEMIQEFIKEKGPEIRKKIEDLIKELEQSGQEKEAEKWKKFLNEEFQKET